MNCFENPLSIFSYFASEVCGDVYGKVSVVYTLSAAQYLQLFLLTVLLEGPIYWLILRKSLSTRKIIAAIFIVNLATHPLVCFAFPRIGQHLHWSEGCTEILSEIFAPVVESSILLFVFKVKPKKAFLAGFAANLFSWLIGSLLVNQL